MFAYMKKCLFALAALSLLFSCTPEDNNNNGGGGQNNQDELTVTGEALEITDHSATLTGYAYLPFELGYVEVGIMYDKSQSFGDAKKAVATGLDGNNKFTVSATGLEPSTTYYYKAYAQNGMAVKYGAVKSFTTKESTIPSGAVDLGIVMTRTDGTNYKLYWAKSNLSESGLCAKPEDYGDYFAWGETTAKDNYTWETYQFCSGSSSTLTKYCGDSEYGNNGFADNLTELLPEDDAAYVNWGPYWRMPTEEQQEELCSQCTWTWDTRSGKNGYKAVGPNGNSLFLPAAGYRDYGRLSGVGTKGYYWSRTLGVGWPNCASDLYFRSSYMTGSSDYRINGNPVRPVRASQ